MRNYSLLVGEVDVDCKLRLVSTMSNLDLYGQC